MPKVYKASTVKLDINNRVSIEILDMSPPEAAEEAEPEELDVFKKVPAEPDAQYIVDDIISKAKAEAVQIQKKAEAEACRMVDEARSEAQRAAAELTEKSRNEGYQKGYGEGASEGERIKAEAQRIRDEAEAFREEMVNSIEPDMLDLVVSVLNKLLEKAAVIDESVIMNLIRQGLSGATLTGDIKIHVSRQDYDDVLSKRDEILTFGNFTNAKLEFVQDSSLRAADCIIETPFGNIDCSLNGQYESLKEGLYYILDNR